MKKIGRMNMTNFNSIFKPWGRKPPGQPHAGGRMTTREALALMAEIDARNAQRFDRYTQQQRSLTSRLFSCIIRIEKRLCTEGG